MGTSARRGIPPPGQGRTTRGWRVTRGMVSALVTTGTDIYMRHRPAPSVPRKVQRPSRTARQAPSWRQCRHGRHQAPWAEERRCPRQPSPGTPCPQHHSQRRSSPPSRRPSQRAAVSICGPCRHGCRTPPTCERAAAGAAISRERAQTHATHGLSFASAEGERRAREQSGRGVAYRDDEYSAADAMRVGRIEGGVAGGRCRAWKSASRLP